MESSTLLTRNHSIPRANWRLHPPYWEFTPLLNFPQYLYYHASFTLIQNITIN